jgi:hypothetical protein
MALGVWGKFMALLFYEPVTGISDTMGIYRRSNDPNGFFFIPHYAALTTGPDGRLVFGAGLLHKPDGSGYGIVNMTCRPVIDQNEVAAATAKLKQRFGPAAGLSAANPDTVAPFITASTTFPGQVLNCQATGSDLYNDLGLSLTVSESVYPLLAGMLQNSDLGWTGVINFTFEVQHTSCQWQITANWKSVADHFKAMADVKYWQVEGNLSAEVLKLVSQDAIKIVITGGTPGDQERVETMAEKIAARLFAPAVQPQQNSTNPSAGIACFSFNFTHSEVDGVSTTTETVNALVPRPTGIAVRVGHVPSDYFYSCLFEDYDKIRSKVEVFRKA